jgi:hypothetical protein
MPDQRLEKLKSILQLVDESISKKDFEANFKILIEFVKKLKEMTAQEMEAMRVMMKSFEAKMETDCKDEMEKMDKEMTAKCETETNKIMLAHEAMMSEMDKRAEIMEESMPDEALIAKQASDLAVEAIKPLIVPNDDLKLEIPKLGDLIASTLEDLPEEKKLLIEAVKGLREELDELRAMKSRVLGGVGGFNYGALTMHQVNEEIPTNSGDDLNFTINHAPSPTTSLKVYRNGQRLHITDDFTFSGKNITLLNALTAGEIFFCDYYI